MLYTYNKQQDIFQLTSSVRTDTATNVDFKKLEEILTLFTNTFYQSNQSRCVTQTLYKFSDNSQVKFASVLSCNVIKSIILSQANDVITIAILSSTVDGYRQLEIFDVFKNSSYARKQVIATYYASDVAQVTTKSETFLVIANTYDTSTEALSVSYTVPVTVLR